VILIPVFVIIVQFCFEYFHRRRKENISLHGISFNNNSAHNNRHFYCILIDGLLVISMLVMLVII